MRSVALRPAPVSEDLSFSDERDTSLLPTRSPATASPTASTWPAAPGDADGDLQGLRLATELYLPLDLVVPRRSPIGDGVLEDVPLHLRFVLLRMDGATSLADIAVAACLSRADAVALFLELLDLGVVELHTRAVVDGVPVSGIYRVGAR